MSKLETRYEWKAEHVDNYGDILDIDFDDDLKRLIRVNEGLHEGLEVRLCLVRDRGNDEEGLKDRQHFYIEDGVLLNSYETGIKPPNKYVNQVRKLFY